MIYEVIQSVKAKTARGNTETIPIGAIIDIDPVKAAILVKDGQLKPYTLDTGKEDQSRPPGENPHPQGSMEARRESLIAVMEALWISEFQGIINKVLNGQARLADFKEATDRWARLCATELKSLTS